MKNRISKYLAKKCAIEMRIVMENFDYDKITTVQHITGVTGRICQLAGSDLDSMELVFIDFELRASGKTEATCYVFLNTGCKLEPAQALRAMHQLQYFIDTFSVNGNDKIAMPALLRITKLPKAFNLQASKWAALLKNKNNALVFYNPLREITVHVVPDAHETCTGTLNIEFR